MSELRCEVCGKPEGPFFVNHWEEHVSPSRRLTICRSCHSKLHSFLHTPRFQIKNARAWHIRVDRDSEILVQRALERGFHVTKSELVKDAVKHYLEEKFPKLVEKVRGEGEKMEVKEDLNRASIASSTTR